MFVFFFCTNCVTRAHFLWGRSAKEKQTKTAPEITLHAMNKFNFWHHCLLWEGSIGGYPIPQHRKKNWQIPCQKVWILRKILRKTSLTINTFSLAITLNEYCKCDTAYVNHRSESVSFYECYKSPVRLKQTNKKMRGKEGGKLTTTATEANISLNNSW